MSQTITDMPPEARVEYRIVATNDEGTVRSEARKFTTLAVPPTFVSSFGSAGTGIGQFGRASFIAVDASGKNSGPPTAKTTACRSSARAAPSSPSTEPKALATVSSAIPAASLSARTGAFGSSTRVTLELRYSSSSQVYEGQLKNNGSSPDFSEPVSITVTHGYVYVGDYGKEAVVKVAESGGAPEVLPKGEYGLVTISTPAGLASDAAGHVFLSNYDHDEILQYRESDSWLPWGREVTSQGEMAGPYGLAVKPSGNLVVADKPNNRIELFAPGELLVGGGESLTSAGAAGAGPGQFNEPIGVALGPGGNIYVADAANHRIERWNEVTRPRSHKFACDGGQGHQSDVERKGRPGRTSDHLSLRIRDHHCLRKPAPRPNRNRSGAASTWSRSGSPWAGLAPETNYFYRVVATNSEGTTYGSRLSFTTLPVAASTSSFGSAGTGPGQFARPLGVTR